jgi:hypothetical protein
MGLAVIPTALREVYHVSDGSARISSMASDVPAERRRAYSV